MKALLQRVRKGSVSVDGTIVGSIDYGFVVLLGIHRSDTMKDADILVKKILNLRVFADGDEKMNRSLRDVGGALLVVSQFTLYADTRKGNRPSFTEAAPPDKARALYDYCITELQNHDVTVETGEFGAMMQVEIHNDGPVTILLET